VKRGCLWLPAIFVPRLIRGQEAMAEFHKRLAWQKAHPSGGGGSNNVALVGSQKDGATDGTQPSSRAFAMPGNVTSGNVVIFIGFVFHGAALTITSGMLTKTAGTATIGTIVMDSSTNATTTLPGIGIWRVPVTGSGSLTLTFNYATSAFSGVAAAEFSGMNATPLDSNSGTSGTGTAETSGTVTTVGAGVIVAGFAEGNSGLNWTRTNSDQVIFQDSNATTHFTCCAQYKINSGTSNTVTSTSDASGTNWASRYASYKTS
jgi:hypothetical protein